MGDFWSTIHERPELALGLRRVLDALAGGATLDDALRRAGVERADADAILDAARRSLDAAGARSRAGVAAKGAGRRAPGGGPAVVAHADGGSRGNPGEAACAVVLYDETGAELLRRSERIGRATNNVAEYRGVLLALGVCRELSATSVTLRLDSELVVRQMTGAYRVRHPDLRPLHRRAMEMAGAFPSFRVEHVPRTRNREADALVNAALDGREPD